MLPETDRPSWETYFMDIATLVARRSTCLRRSVGAVLVRDKRLLSTGYNGAPVGLRHCDEIGCLRESMNVASGERHELCRGIHAEQNAIIQAALHGVSTKGATLFCTNFPCSICAKMLVNAGIEKVCYQSEYSDLMAGKYFKEAGVRVVRLTSEE
ncbi:MAG: cytidine deaminase [Desulfobacteraceae bacterium 4572_88]|nr:MAG: cytidine deaminase [Desulfobacteraceae bacterium 4572_88]